MRGGVARDDKNNSEKELKRAIKNQTEKRKYTIKF
jgi:hypothetical protein